MIAHALIPLLFASINVELRPVDNGLGIYVVGNGTDLVASMEIAVDGNIAGATNAPFLLDFPAFPGWLPCNADLSTGGMWIGLVPGGVEFAPTAAGTLVTTLQVNDCGYVDFLILLSLWGPCE